MWRQRAQSTDSQPPSQRKVERVVVIMICDPIETGADHARLPKSVPLIPTVGIAAH